MANNHSTHTIRNFAAQKKSVLHRNDTGMVIAVRDGLKVAWGEDPRQQEQRAFCDVAFATAFLRKVADADQRVIEQAKWRPLEGVEPSAEVVVPDFSNVCARIEEVDGESRIYGGVQ